MALGSGLNLKINSRYTNIVGLRMIYYSVLGFPAHTLFTHKSCLYTCLTINRRRMHGNVALPSGGAVWRTFPGEQETQAGGFFA